ILILSRDMLIILGWLVVYILTGNRRIEPRPSGKLATALQMAATIARLFAVPDPAYRYIIAFMLATTVISTIDYIWVGNKRLGAIA
ncbi:MAG TPA: hypothetical protein VMU17_01365, partial [Elusimicrobiota bacterium]|nr:hypothetical protein [Elusimicrobiota bacterium]